MYFKCRYTCGPSKTRKGHWWGWILGMDEFYSLGDKISAGGVAKASSLARVRILWLSSLENCFPSQQWEDCLSMQKASCKQLVGVLYEVLHCMAVKHEQLRQMIKAHTYELKCTWHGGWVLCHWKNGNLMQNYETGWELSLLVRLSIQSDWGDVGNCQEWRKKTGVRGVMSKNDEGEVGGQGKHKGEDFRLKGFSKDNARDLMFCRTAIRKPNWPTQM